LPAASAWPWVIGSGILHCGYKLFLVRAYDHGDLGQVYPLARGSAPLIVALVGAAFLGEQLQPASVVAIAAIATGVILMSFRGGRGLEQASATAIAYALGTACFTAAYTLTDAVGARLAATASGFTMAMFIVDGACMLGFTLGARGAASLRAFAPAWRPGVIAGLLSLGSYWIAVWAFTRAPVALVAALRETSVLFAMLIGTFIFREPTNRWRWSAGGLILCGIILMRV
jgi:drug/metabolite transporter (DMT)-like permease